MGEVLPSHIQQLNQMASAYWVSRVLYAAAKLGLADHFEGGPKSVAELAGATRTHAPSLYRLMRTLASLGVLSEDVNHCFSLTPLGQELKTGAPGYARSTLLTLGSDYQWRGWEQLVYSVETGNSGMEKAFGISVFEYFAQHPEESSYFNETMIGFTCDQPVAVADAYDFSGFETLIDVGGGTGILLATILERHPGPRGILADLPYVVREAPALIELHGLAGRVTIESIDFFKSVPGGGDLYLLKHVIHGWNEDQCLTILGNCRRAMKPGGRLLIIEMVIPPGDTPHPGKLMDMNVLVMAGGQERTEDEYGTLLNKAGFRLTRLVPTKSAVSVVEAIPN